MLPAKCSPMPLFTLLPLMFAFALLALAPPALAMSGGCGGECASCHSLSVKEANLLLKDLGEVTRVQPAAVRGLYEITLKKNGATAITYLDYGKKHLIGGQIFDLASRQVVGGAEETRPVVRLNPATLSTDATLVMGNPKGKKRLFVFTDPECPFCAKMHAELKKLAALQPDLAIYIKLFPLKMHPHAYDKARVIMGARSLALLEKSYAGGKLPAPGAKDSRLPVDATLAYAKSVGIDATPTLVLQDGRILPGLKDAETMRRLLQ